MSRPLDNVCMVAMRLLSFLMSVSLHVCMYTPVSLPELQAAKDQTDDHVRQRQTSQVSRAHPYFTGVHSRRRQNCVRPRDSLRDKTLKRVAARGLSDLRQRQSGRL